MGFVLYGLCHSLLVTFDHLILTQGFGNCPFLPRGDEKRCCSCDEKLFVRIFVLFPSDRLAALPYGLDSHVTQLLANLLTKPSVFYYYLVLLFQ